MRKIIYLSVLCLTLSFKNVAMAVEKDVDMSKTCKSITIEEKKEDINTETIKGGVKLPIIVTPKNEFTNGINERLNKWVKEWLNDLEDLSKKYQEDTKKIKGLEFHPFEVDSNYVVENKSCPYLSFYVDYYQFTGGAHGNTVRKTYNYDLNKQQELLLKNLFKEGYQYKDVINKEISNQINKNKDYYFTDENGFKGITENQPFTFNNKGVTIYFQQYDIAPYVTGIPSFFIPNELLKDGLIINK